MRREQRIKEKQEFKKMLYVSGAVAAILLIVLIFIFMSYANKLGTNSSSMEESRIAKITNNITKNEILEEASSKIGKTVEQSQNEIEEKSVDLKNTVETLVEQNSNILENAVIEEPVVENDTKEVIAKEEKVKDPEFIIPVEGEIIKEYANENLVYSETLKEWVTHNGIDIKADKATVVKSAEDGTVTSIKNDPRYGMTITVDHASGYQTRYSNLLTTEFVAVGERVSKEQTIGTVGNTAAFEIADETHLHFEILKDGENLDPSLYIK